MPHDKYGEKLNEGDFVLVWGKVKTIYQTEGYCNVTFETLEDMYPGKDKSTFTLNAKQVEKAQPAEDFIRRAREAHLLEEKEGAAI